MLQNIDDNDDNDNDVAKHKEPKSIKNAPTGTNTNWKTFCKSLLREDCQEVFFKYIEITPLKIREKATSIKMPSTGNCLILK